MRWSYTSKTQKLHPKIPWHHKQLQQCNRIQNQLTKISKLSIHQQWTHWERIYEYNSIYNSLKKIKYLGINLTKAINDLYKENYKPLKKEIKVDYMDWQNQLVKMAILLKSLSMFNAIPIKIPMTIHHRHWKIYPKIDLETQKTESS
jgi:hypothetical protein